MKLRPVVVPQCPSRRGWIYLRFKEAFQQRIVLQIDLPDAEVVRSAQYRIHFFQKFG